MVLREHHDEIHGRHAADDDSGVYGKRERFRREAGHAVDGESEHLAKRVLRLTAEARVATVRKRTLPETDPAHHASDVAALLAHRYQLVHDQAVHEPEVASILGPIQVRESVEPPVEAASGL